MRDFYTILFIWKDGGMSDLIVNGCLTTNRCHCGRRFVLDQRTLAELGRVWYVESQ